MQNNVIRIMTGAQKGTRKKDLLLETRSLSVHQMIEYTTLLVDFNVKKNRKPEYLVKKLHSARNQGQGGRSRDGLKLKVQDYLLEVSGAGFVYRGAKLFNILPRNLREEKKRVV
jgi:hypothetical protein